MSIAEKSIIIYGTNYGTSRKYAEELANVVAKYGGNIKDYEGADKVPGEIVPLVALFRGQGLEMYMP